MSEPEAQTDTPPRPTLRIEALGMIGNKTRVFYVEDEEETELSGVITGLDIKIRVGEVNQVTLYGLVGRGAINAELEQFVVEKLRPILVKDKPVE